MTSCTYNVDCAQKCLLIWSDRLVKVQNSKLRLLWSLYCLATKSVAFTTRSCIPSFSLVRPISSQNLCPRHTPFGSLRTEVYSFLLHPSSKIHCSKIGPAVFPGWLHFIPILPLGRWWLFIATPTTVQCNWWVFIAHQPPTHPVAGRAMQCKTSFLAVSTSKAETLFHLL